MHCAASFGTSAAKELHMKTLHHATGAAVTVVALALSGCTYASEESASSEGNSSGTEPSSNAETIESIKEDPSIAAMVPDDIKNREPYATA